MYKFPADADWLVKSFHVSDQTLCLSIKLPPVEPEQSSPETKKHRSRVTKEREAYGERSGLLRLTDAFGNGMAAWVTPRQARELIRELKKIAD